MHKKSIAALTTVFRERQYLVIALMAALAFAYLSYWLLYQVTTIPAFLQMTRDGDFGAHSYLYAATYWITTVVTIIFFGILSALLVWLWRHSKFSKRAAGTGVFGGVAGALGAACPVCGAFLLSLLGVVGGVSAFPLQGLEFKFLSLALLAGSTVYSARRVAQAQDCVDCNDISGRIIPATISPSHSMGSNQSATLVAALPGPGIRFLPLEKIITSVLIVLFLVNQLLISSVSVATGASPSAGFVGALFGINTAAAATVIAPKLNPDGRTTSLVEQPTITEVPANPNTGDAVADAKVVMFPTGKPFYAPDDISFDDPINAQKKWKSIGFGLQLTAEQEARWQGLTNTFTCNYCCGGPNNVTTISRCGCAHSYAWQGFFRYMIATYGDKYTDEQIKGEAYRWTGIWYPKGVLEDYLLATGKGNALGHQTHGGAGSDGRHGL